MPQAAANTLNTRKEERVGSRVERVERAEGIEMNSSEIKAVVAGNPAKVIKKRVVKG